MNREIPLSAFRRCRKGVCSPVSVLAPERGLATLGLPTRPGDEVGGEGATFCRGRRAPRQRSPQPAGPCPRGAGGRALRFPQGPHRPSFPVPLALRSRRVASAARGVQRFPGRAGQAPMCPGQAGQDGGALTSHHSLPRRPRQGTHSAPLRTEPENTPRASEAAILRARFLNFIIK